MEEAQRLEIAERITELRERSPFEAEARLRRIADAQLGAESRARAAKAVFYGTVAAVVLLALPFVIAYFALLARLFKTILGA